MVNIDKTNISITRGDSAYLEFFVPSVLGEPATITANDRIRCQVRKAPITGSTVPELVFDGDISYQAEKNSIVWHIRPSDTGSLDTGTYYWDAQIEYANGDVTTFVGVSDFVVLPEVTLKGG